MKITFEHVLGSDATKDAAVLAFLQTLTGKKSTAAKTKTSAPPEEEVTEEEDLDGGGEDEGEAQPTLERVREAAQGLIAGGKSAKLKEILKSFSAAKVVDVEKKDYAAFLKKVLAVK